MATIHNGIIKKSLVSGKNKRLLRFARNDEHLRSSFERRGWLAAAPPTNPSSLKRIIIIRHCERSEAISSYFLFLRTTVLKNIE